MISVRWMTWGRRHASKAVGDEIKMLKDGDKVVADQKAMIESMKNPEEYKKQTLARAKQMAAKQLAAHRRAVQLMVNKASSYQKKAGTLLAKTSDMPKRRDPLKKLKTYERFCARCYDADPETGSVACGLQSIVAATG